VGELCPPGQVGTLQSYHICGSAGPGQAFFFKRSNRRIASFLLEGDLRGPVLDQKGRGPVLGQKGRGEMLPCQRTCFPELQRHHKHLLSIPQAVCFFSRFPALIPSVSGRGSVGRECLGQTRRFCRSRMDPHGADPAVWGPDTGWFLPAAVPTRSIRGCHLARCAAVPGCASSTFGEMSFSSAQTW